MQVTIRFGQFDVDAGLYRELTSLTLVPRDVVAMSIGPVCKLPDGVIIRNDKALEFPFFAKDIANQPTICVRRNAIDLVIRGHHADRTGLVDRLLERK